jgi:hypothetical protein
MRPVDGAADSFPSIGYRWIKAHAYSALFTAVVGFLIYALRRVLAIGDPDTSAIVVGFSVAAGSILLASTAAIYAVLTGWVLARQLGTFPMRAWLLLHGFIGLAAGILASLGEVGAMEVQAELDTETMLGTVLTTMVLGVLAGAAIGSVQALLLRRAARSVRLWIGYSALGGAVLGLSLLIGFALPLRGIGGVFGNEIAGALATLLMGLILLPAVRRLEPRAPESAAAAPPPP